MHKTKKNRNIKKKNIKKTTIKKRSKCIYTDEAKRIIKQIKEFKKRASKSIK